MQSCTVLGISQPGNDAIQPLQFGGEQVHLALQHQLQAPGMLTMRPRGLEQSLHASAAACVRSGAGSWRSGLVPPGSVGNWLPGNTFPADELVSYPDVLDGVGPYRMVSLVAGEQMVLEANPDYYGEDKAQIENVIIRYYADPTTMSNAVESGEIDIAWRTLGPVEATRLQEVEGLTVLTVEAPALRYLVFNHEFMVPAE